MSNIELFGFIFLQEKMKVGQIFSIYKHLFISSSTEVNQKLGIGEVNQKLGIGVEKVWVGPLNTQEK